MSSQTPTTVYITSNKDANSSSIAASTALPMPMRPNSSAHYIYSTPPNAPISLSQSNDLSYHSSRVSAGMPYPTFPGSGGSAAAILEFGPGSEFPIHRTNTVDYLFVMEGEMELSTADGDKKVVKKGDIVVQRGAWHTWKNHSETETVKFAAVSLGCEGAEEGKMIMQEEGA